ncbi:MULTISPECIES: AI-2E family transporter [Methylorubrum]|uniref:AI-2E family transporter n=1 Tax=Methylorubrum TaxID=2282523 RepID=UPI0020A170BE|nr:MULTISPECIES: AI-2E family transporter [Methylorubrum]MCP1547465.1 putative PurR-regulated permease PerM [Methylorubrum zatmanii]MCP1555919.1 putative PurR-regulated permease PerM [Methylorubrum extorquens]MCP1577768.1 putative PurR-regulated permease PerM [Methylorubrum extorquens]
MTAPPFSPPANPPGARRLAAAGIAVVAFAAALWLAWTAAATLLLIFSGILFAVFLDGLTRGLGYVLPIGRGWRLTLVCLVLAALAVGLSAFGGATVASQARDLGATVRQQSETVRDWLKERGVEIDLSQGAPAGAGQGGEGKDKNGKEGGLAGLASGALKSPGSLLSDAGSVLGPAASVVLALFNALGNVLVIVFLGVAIAADPGSYRNGALRLVPPRHRETGARVLDGSGETLRHWLFGQLVTMAAIFVLTWAGLSFLGIGGALILGLQAGLLAFVPTVGPLIAGLVIVLSSLASGLNGLLGALGVYLAVQAAESYGLTPFIQRRALDLPAATIFAGQLLLGVLFGLWGVALALPLVAVIKVLLEELYIEDGAEAEA